MNFYDISFGFRTWKNSISFTRIYPAFRKRFISLWFREKSKRGREERVRGERERGRGFGLGIFLEETSELMAIDLVFVFSIVSCDLMFLERISRTFADLSRNRWWSFRFFVDLLELMVFFFFCESVSLLILDSDVSWYAIILFVVEIFGFSIL